MYQGNSKLFNHNGKSCFPEKSMFYALTRLLFKMLAHSWCVKVLV